MVGVKIINIFHFKPDFMMEKKMLQIGESSLSQLLLKDINIRLVEPNIYSVFPNDEVGNSYENKFGNFYDLVACNSLYNRIMWGYSTKRFTR